MTLTAAEQDSIRLHLGYGNLSSVSLPYTGDTFWTQVAFVSSYLNTGTETSATTAITVSDGQPTVVTVTPAAMTGITTYEQLVVDVADNAEVVMVQATTISTFSAAFSKSHSTNGYPIAVMSGLARLRLLLWDADRAWRGLTDQSIADQAGLKSVDKGDVEWFQGFHVLKDRLSHYMSIVSQISHLTRIEPNWVNQSKRSTRLEAC